MNLKAIFTALTFETLRIPSFSPLNQRPEASLSANSTTSSSWPNRPRLRTEAKNLAGGIENDTLPARRGKISSRGIEKGPLPACRYLVTPFIITSMLLFCFTMDSNTFYTNNTCTIQNL